MSERRKDLLALAGMLGLVILMFSTILFTSKIVRAPDILNEFYWSVKDLTKGSLWDAIRINLSGAGWDIYPNSGFTTEGGGHSLQFLLHNRLLFHLIPAPESVAWFMALGLYFGAAGTYCYCRLIGASRIASVIGGLIFALAPENSSLINAGHVMKIATISYAPWAFYCIEKGFQSRRIIWFMTTGFVLAFQFFNYHWQIAFYTCLGIGVYGLMRLIGIILEDRKSGKKEISRLVVLNLVAMCFFLSTVAISLAPLASWSTGTNRGAQSGANQGKGGLDRDEAMSWSLPPEEVSSFVIPGMFGFSRQEGGENPSNILSYYWGRMHFTQTTDYMGLLPWLLLPLPLIFRRDRYTWLALAAVAGGIIFSMGKYTFVYNLLYDYFPGINRFRVPKMIMFLPVMGLGVFAARGVDILLDEKVRKTRQFKGYLYGVLTLPGILLLVLGTQLAMQGAWLDMFSAIIELPTRYEQGGQLVMQRWNNMLVETAIASGVAAAYAAAVYACSRKWIAAGVIPFVLLALYLGDVGRVNGKFLFLVEEPQKAKGVKTPVMEYVLANSSNQYRLLPMEGSDPMQYAANRIPVAFTSYPVQQVRWQNFLDSLSLMSSMPDMINLKYLVLGSAQYEQEKAQYREKYAPVYRSPDGGQVVLENRSVLPKAWMVPAVAQINDPQQALASLQNPALDLRKVAIVESPPPFPMSAPDKAQPLLPQDTVVTAYEGEKITVTTRATQNAILVLGEKYYRGWRASVDGKPAEIYPVNYILRGVYLTPGAHKVEYVFDPLPFKIGKYLTLASFALFAGMLIREWLLRRKGMRNEV